MCAGSPGGVFGAVLDAAGVRRGDSRWGPEYEGTRKKTKYDSSGRPMYPDSTANMNSYPSQSSLRIGGPDSRPQTTSAGGNTGGLKGDQPLTDKPDSGGGTSGGTGDINY